MCPSLLSFLVFSPCHSLIAERDSFVNFQAACLVAEQAARIGFGFFTRCVAESSLDSFLSLDQFALLSIMSMSSFLFVS